MYCVTCDKNGVLMHADTIYKGDALCRDHADARQDMIVNGTNPAPREADVVPILVGADNA